VEIVITGRRTEVSERFRQQAEEKLTKVSQLAPRAHRVDVELSHERNPRQADICMKVEITVVDRGPVVRAEACAEDSVAAFDIAFGKLLERLRRLGDRRKVHHGRQTPETLRARPGSLDSATGPLTPAGGLAAVNGNGTAAAVATLGSPADDDTDAEPAVPDLAHIGDGEFADGPLVIRAKDHDAEPMTRIRRRRRRIRGGRPRRAAVLLRLECVVELRRRRPRGDRFRSVGAVCRRPGGGPCRGASAAAGHRADLIHKCKAGAVTPLKEQPDPCRTQNS
jgi:ribosomal subunit interface protein